MGEEGPKVKMGMRCKLVKFGDEVKCDGAKSGRVLTTYEVKNQPRSS